MKPKQQHNPSLCTQSVTTRSLSLVILTVCTSKEGRSNTSVHRVQLIHAQKDSWQIHTGDASSLVEPRPTRNSQPMRSIFAYVRGLSFCTSNVVTLLSTVCCTLLFWYSGLKFIRRHKFTGSSPIQSPFNNTWPSKLNRYKGTSTSAYFLLGLLWTRRLSPRALVQSISVRPWLQPDSSTSTP